MLMAELFDKYEAEHLSSLRPRTAVDYHNCIKHLRTVFGPMEATAVTPRDVVTFIDVPTGRQQRNRMTMILSAVFKKAQGRWCVDMNLTNPCLPVERWPTKPRTRYVTDAEFNGMRSICCPQVQIAMDLALLTGQRQGDLVGLTWDRVHTTGLPRDKWHIEIKQGKTGKHLGINISPAIEEVLTRAHRIEPIGQHVIRTETGCGYTEDGFRAMWQRYCRKWERLGHERFHYHDLRAKSISDNQNLDSAYLLAGHIDIKMTRRVYDRNIRMVEPLR